MPDGVTTCVLPDGSTVDLSSASEAEVEACLENPSNTLRLETHEPDVDESSSIPTRSHDMPPNDPGEPEVPVPDAPAAPGPETVRPSAHEVQPDEPPAASVPPSELADLMQSAGGGAMGLAAALIAVVGGTAAFKLWTKISEQKHEQQMKRLDIEQANAGLKGAQPPPCQTAHQTLVAEIKEIRARVSEVEGRASRVEKAAAGMDPSIDVGDLEERIEFLEKALRKRSNSSGGGH